MTEVNGRHRKMVTESAEEAEEHFADWLEEFWQTAEEESRNWSFHVCVYVVEFRLFSDLTYIRVRYICMCVVEFLSFRRWSIYWSCSAGFHTQIMPDLTVDKSHQNICTFFNVQNTSKYQTKFNH